MKETRKPLWIIIQSLICVSLCIGTVILLSVMIDNKKASDTNPPVITFLYGEAEYTLGDDTSVLLNGVIAEDETDGDVTASVRVRNISISEDNTEAVVSYVARDQANNIALVKRIVSVRVIEQMPKAETSGEVQTENTDQAQAAEENNAKQTDNP